MSIIIPMLVEAYLSDGIDVETKRVPQTTPDYSTALYHSFLGSKNTPSPVDDKMPPLRRGVHLHFILPDAFKKGDETGVFPEVPDKYIVTRFLAAQGKAKVRQWIVESSFISTDAKYGKNVAIPMFQDKNGIKFRYCGRAYDIREKPDQKAEYLDSLSAIGGGDPFFAAYYPSCHSIFGFCDDMEGVAEGAKVSYFVTGYFARKDHDPFYKAKTSEELTALLAERNLFVENPEKICDRCLLFGVVEDIVWTNGSIVDYIPSGNIDVAIGRTSAEALSAAADKLLTPATQEFQKLFNALQYGEASRIREIDGPYFLEDGIVLRQYQRLDGDCGSYVLNGTDKENSSMAENFSQIQKDKQSLSRTIGVCKSDKAKLSVLWEQYMLLYENDDAQHTPDIPSKEEMLAEIRRVAKSIKGKEEYIEKEKKRIESRITETMAATGDAPYFIAKEPALLLCGDGVERSYAFGENGRYTSSGMLECQTQTLTCNIDAKDILSCFTFVETELGDEYRTLFLQAVLLIKETKVYLEGKYGPLSICGHVSPIMVNDKPGDFVTLFMDWQLLFYPVRSSGDRQKDNTLSHCSFSYGRTEFYTKESIGSRCITYTGRSILTPHASLNLKQRFKEWLDAHDGDKEIERAAELLDTLPIISQNLSGLNDQLKGMMQAYEFPVMGNGGDEQEAAAVAAYAASAGNSVLPGYPLFPLGGGYFRVSLIHVVGTFGQTQQVYVPTANRIPDTIYSETLESSFKGFGFLNPGFLTPSRVMLRWLWKEGVYSSSAKETTPVAGFLVPELLNRRFVVYSSRGCALGELKTVKRDGSFSTRWVSAPGLPQELKQVEMCAELKRFLTVMLNRNQAFPEVMKVVEGVLEKTLPDTAGKKLWGKTLALSRAEAALEFLGYPDFTKDFSEFGKYNTLGAAKIRIPLALGDIGRSLDGFVGAFCSDAFESMYPPFGMKGEDKSGYVRYGDTLSISEQEAGVPLYLLAEVSASITVQTGLHPPGSLKLLPAHQEPAGQLMLLTELNPILTPDKKAELPFADRIASGENQTLLFQLAEGNKAVYWETGMPQPLMQDTVICDGRAALLNIPSQEGEREYGKES